MRSEGTFDLDLYDHADSLSMLNIFRTTLFKASFQNFGPRLSNL